MSSNQQKYLDRDNYHLTREAAMCLAGWDNLQAVVHSPNLECLNLPESTINSLIDGLVLNSFDEFKVQGGLRPTLRSSIASLIMYDPDVKTDLTPRNCISLALREAYERLKLIDSRASEPTVNATIALHAELIRKDFRNKNKDFCPLELSSSNVQTVNAMNQIGSSVASIQIDQIELRQQVRHLINVVEDERIIAQAERTENQMLRQGLFRTEQKLARTEQNLARTEQQLSQAVGA